MEFVPPFAHIVPCRSSDEIRTGGVEARSGISAFHWGVISTIVRRSNRNFRPERRAMAARICPHCKAEISAAEAVTLTNGIDCPNCGMRLEVGPGSRTVATLCGLAAGAIAWRLSAGLTGDLGGVLPTLYAFLAFGVVSPLALMFTAALRNAPALPVPEPAHSAGGHAPASHDSGDHGGHH